MNNNEDSKVQLINEDVLEGVSGGINDTALTNKRAVFEKVASKIENFLGLPKGSVESSSSFSDLGADSLDVVDIVSGVEDDFRINCNAEQFIGNTTIDDLCNIIISKIKK